MKLRTAHLSKYLCILVGILSLVMRINNQKTQGISLDDSDLETLSYGESKVNVRFETQKVAMYLNSKPINCFQLSTATPDKDFPGKSSMSDVNDRTLRRNLKEDGAIQIVFSKGAARLENDTKPDLVYFVIGVMWYPGEYHFVRLFKDGWFSKPSKVGTGFWVTDKKKLPSEGLASMLKKTSGPRAYNFLGFYLYPVNEENRNKLLNKNLQHLDYLE